MADGRGVHQVACKAGGADGKGWPGGGSDGQSQGDGGKCSVHVWSPLADRRAFSARLQTIDASVHASVAFMRPLYTPGFAGFLSGLVKFYEI
ncbi:hypothetical protein RHECNPAF_4300132 [Rhizobium etli CNPAF512]|nr:hypothetical protein RHECNPAF_4300132 [Rhizobium etli CNPAF512]